jgi:uncharacterized protein YndB with AHSA1/START domain
MTSTAEKTMTTQVFRVFIKATPQAVWDAITDPEWNHRYGYRSRQELELRPGGAYRAFATPDMSAHGAPAVIIDGELLEVDAPRRLVQTWHAMFDEATSAEPPTRLTWELSETAQGVTRLTVTHELEGAPKTAEIVSGAAEEAGGGWAMILSDLKTLLETGQPIDFF